MKLKKQEFRALYIQCLNDILQIRPIDQQLKDVLAIYEYGYKDYNFRYYLERSWIRAWQVYKLLPDNIDNKTIKILDIGSFFGNFALCFKRLGYDVTADEVYSYYGNTFVKLRAFLEQERIKVLDEDFTMSLPETLLQDKYDVILCLAVLEHLAYSPELLFNNIKKVMALNGCLILEVPNLAYWCKRMQLLRGISVLTPIEFIYKSKTPYMGHNHEYTEQELKSLSQLVGLHIEQFVFYNYSLATLTAKLINAPGVLFNNCKEIIAVKFKR